MAKYEDAPDFLIKELEKSLSKKDKKKALELAKYIPGCIIDEINGTVTLIEWKKKK